MKSFKSYCRFTLAEREEISRGLINDETFGAIGGKIGKDKSAISREVNRAGMGRFTYRAPKGRKKDRAGRENWKLIGDWKNTSWPS